MPFSHIVFTRNPSACYSCQLLLFTPTPSISHNSSVPTNFCHSHQLPPLFTPTPIIHNSCVHTNSYCSHQFLLLFTPVPPIVHQPTPTVHSTSSSCSHQLLLLFTTPMFTPTPIIYTNSYRSPQFPLFVHTNSYCSQQLLLLFAPVPPIVHTNSRAFFKRNYSIPIQRNKSLAHLHCK